MRDNDYVYSFIESKKDPFIVTSKRKADALVLRSALSKIDPSLRNCRDLTKSLTSISLLSPKEKEYEPIGGTRFTKAKATHAKIISVNLSMAALGGGLLIAPMWLMVLHNTTFTGLGITTGCVILFGVIVSWKLKDAVDVLSVTAAYAAVLVVFVGASNGNSG